MSKQDRQGARTASDLERKYNFGKTFAELMGLANDARESVDSLASELRNEITEQSTSLTRSAEEIAMKAISETTFADDIEALNTEVSELKVTSGKISLDFEKTEKKLNEVDGDLKSVVEDLQKHFEFTVDGLVIKAGDNSMSLLIDNDLIRFQKNGQDFGWWDGVNFHTGNIFVDVDEVAQFGNYGFVPYDGSDADGLDLVRVGE